MSTNSLGFPNGPLKVPDKLTDQWLEQYQDNRWLGLGDTSQISIVSPFATRSKFDVDNPHIFLLDLMRKPEYFGFTCKVLFGKTLAPFQIAILRELWIRPFPMLIASRGAGKSWILAVYCMLRALFNQGTKIIICGSAFRQSKVVFDYCQDLWENGPVYRDLVGPEKKNGPRRDVDRCTLRSGESLIVALPLGDGEKIRGQRANVVLGEEFASIPQDIFERVVRGFGAVALDPVNKFRAEMRVTALKELGLWHTVKNEGYDSNLSSNQTIISGTAYYAFNHFYEYWRRYKGIVESRGDTRKLAELNATDVNWKDYSVIRIPVQALPDGFMDEKQLSQARAMIHSSIYDMEYGGIFCSDSNGFYKRSLIESCVVGKDQSPIEVPSCGVVKFNVVLRGDPTRHYVLGVDPASEQDNFSVVILECWGDHRRIVFCWTTTRARYKAKAKVGLTTAGDFYSYTARKIRDLAKLFPAERIAIDSQGGGVAVMEALQDPGNMNEGERPFYPVIVEDDHKDTDDLAGEHIIEIINFARADWVAEANHTMKKDFEDKALLFPAFDPAVVALAHEDDKDMGRVIVNQTDASVEALFDTLEDAVLEAEDLKDELASIAHTQTGVSMRDRWDTPETKVAGGKKGRLRKDRYSALLMANMVARTLQRTPKKEGHAAVGGFAHDIRRGPASKDGPMYTGPQWWAQGGGGGHGAVVRR